MIEMPDISWSNGCFDLFRIAFNALPVCEPAKRGCRQAKALANTLYKTLAAVKSQSLQANVRRPSLPSLSDL